jgi:hypothetical protein
MLHKVSIYELKHKDWHCYAQLDREELFGFSLAASMSMCHSIQ